jgi:hypothetical protein
MSKEKRRDDSEVKSALAASRSLPVASGDRACGDEMSV